MGGHETVDLESDKVTVRKLEAQLRCVHCMTRTVHPFIPILAREHVGHSPKLFY